MVISETLKGKWYLTESSSAFPHEVESSMKLKFIKNVMQQLINKSKSDEYSTQKGDISIVSAVENFIKEWIDKVHFINYQEIKEYLEKHIELVDKLPIAIEIVKKHFPDSQIALEYYQDPETDDKYIVIYVRLKNYDENFIDRLLEACKEVAKKLGINISRHLILYTDYKQIA